MKREELVSAFKLLLPGIETGTPLLEGADNFMFCDNWIRSNNGRVTVSYPFDSELEGSVRAIEFLRILEKMDGDELTLTIEKETLEIECGDATLSMRILPLPSHAGLDVPDEWQPVSPDFMQAFKLSSISVSSNPILGILSGLHVNGNDMLACDNYRASWYVMKEPMDSFVTTAEAAKHISKFDIVGYHVGESDVAFRTKDGVIYTCSKVSGMYPSEKIKELFTNAKQGETFLLPKKLIDSAERAALLASMGESGTEYISLKGTKKSIVVTGEKNFGKFKEKVKLNDGESFPDGILDFNPKFLQAVLKITNQMYDAGDNNMIFIADNFKHLMGLVVES